MSDEIIPRKSRKLNDPSKLPNAKDLLSTKAVPDFLEKKEENKFIEKELAHKNVAQSISEPAETGAVISKQADISKAKTIDNKKTEEAALKYNNFINYMELRNLAGEENEEYLVDNVDTEVQGPKKEEKRFNRMDEIDQIIEKSKGIKKSRKGGNSIKEKEKARRMKGQSSISTWKPDLYMKLRQEYD